MVLFLTTFLYSLSMGASLEVDAYRLVQYQIVDKSGFQANETMVDKFINYGSQSVAINKELSVHYSKLDA
jgi:hypothetical protein